MMLFGPGDGMVLYEKVKGLVVVVVDFAENTTVVAPTLHTSDRAEWCKFQQIFIPPTHLGVLH